MIFHENRLLADDSHVISCLIFVRKLGKMLQNLSSAAVVIGALRVRINMVCSKGHFSLLKLPCHLEIFAGRRSHNAP